MPLPKPGAGESEDAFVSRCMSALKDEFPDQDQRLAVCFKQARGEGRDFDPNQPRDTFGKWTGGLAGSLGAKVKAAKTVGEVAEFLKGKSAGEVGKAVAGHHRAKDALSFVLQSLLSHAAGLDQSTWKLNEDSIDHGVSHFSQIAGYGQQRGRELLKSTVQRLIALREQQLKGRAKRAMRAGGEEEDLVLKYLRELERLLEKPPPEERFDPNQPRDDSGKWTDGGGAGSGAGATPAAPKAKSSLLKIAGVSGAALGTIGTAGLIGANLGAAVGAAMGGVGALMSGQTWVAPAAISAGTVVGALAGTAAGAILVAGAAITVLGAKGVAKVARALTRAKQVETKAFDGSADLEEQINGLSDGERARFLAALMDELDDDEATAVETSLKHSGYRFDEEKHPRGQGGKFVKAEGGGSSSESVKDIAKTSGKSFIGSAKSALRSALAVAAPIAGHLAVELAIAVAIHYGGGVLFRAFSKLPKGIVAKAPNVKAAAATMKPIKPRAPRPRMPKGPAFPAPGEALDLPKFIKPRSILIAEQRDEQALRAALAQLSPEELRQLAELIVEELDADQAEEMAQALGVESARGDLADIETRAVGAADLSVADKTLRGYAAVFDQLSGDLGGFREQIMPGAFAESLRNGEDVRALFNHDPNFVLGRTRSGTLSLREDRHGLAFAIDLPDTQAVRDLVVAPIERGDISQMSFGFTVRDNAQEWQRSGEGMVRTLRAVKLFDISPVTYAAYPETTVALRSLARARELDDAAIRRNLVRAKTLMAALF